MTKEQLIAAGLTEQQADAVLKLHKDSIDGNYIPKTTFDAERNKVKELDQQVKDRDKQITELGTFKGTAEELTKKVSELETKNKTDKDAADARVTQLEQDYLIKSEIGSIVYDADDVMSKLDKTKIVFKDGKIVAGLKEQADELKKSKPHYFKPDQTTQQQNKVPGFSSLEVLLKKVSSSRLPRILNFRQLSLANSLLNQKLELKAPFLRMELKIISIN
jgi:hypothetical protein